MLTVPITANHLDKIFMWKKNPEDKSEIPQPFVLQIYDFVTSTQKDRYERACNIHQNLIKKKKGESAQELDPIELPLEQEAIEMALNACNQFESLMKFHENELLATEDGIFSGKILDQTPGQETEEDEYLLEKTVV